MSTRINVNIGDGGLLDRNAQQQAAARQANQQRASADKAAAEGQRQLEQERIRKGLDPLTGERLPSAGSSSRIQRIDQDPAANRKDQAPHVLLGPFASEAEDYVNYGGTLNGLISRAKGIAFPMFSRFIHPLTTEYTPPTLEVITAFGTLLQKEGVITPNAGPGGAAALELDPPDYPVESEVVSGFVQYSDSELLCFASDPESGPVNIPRPSGFASVDEKLVYAAVTPRYDTVLDWQATTTSAVAPPNPPYNILTKDRTFIPATTKYTYSKIQNFTHEFFIRSPLVDYLGARTGVSVIAATATAIGMGYSINAAGLRLIFSFEESITPDNRTYDAGICNLNGQPITTTTNLWTTSNSIGGIPPTAPSGLIDLNRLNYGPNFSVSISALSPVLQSTIFPNSNFQLSRNISANGIDITTNTTSAYLSLIQKDWSHIAICRKVIGQTAKWYIFINGIELVQTYTAITGAVDAPYELTEKAEWQTTYGTQPASASLLMGSSSGRNASTTLLKPAISSYRFTPKALYTENFVPPSSVVSFA
jgi:hypothetical protein